MKPMTQYINEVKLPEGMPSLVDWDKILEAGGYYPIHLSAYSHWSDIIWWCNNVVGEGHYTWTGYTMWFEREEDAVMFALRWL